jgi:VanZ family protein
MQLVPIATHRNSKAEDRLNRATLAKPLFWAATAFAYVMAVLPHPPEVPGAPSDKVQHVIAFATLGFLAAWAFPNTSRLQLWVRLSLFGAFIELSQAIPALHRDADVVDWIADTIACGLALLIVGWWRARTRNSA